MLVPIAAVAMALASIITVPASADPVGAPALSITPITWNVIGLDSNRPAAEGPDTFPVGARICNTGNAAAESLSSSFVFDSASAALNVSGPGSLALGSLGAGSCTDAYYNVVVMRAAASFNQARRYRITASAVDAVSVATPANRELYVEKLVSQSRNDVQGISGTGVQILPTEAAPGRASVVVGHTYTFAVESATAPGGYEQLESFLNFPTNIFQVLSVDAAYATPVGGRNDTVYADACGWDNAVSTARGTTYRSCVGPARYAGGKVGGDPIVTTYTVKVIAAGTGQLGTLIYDFSGSSFHYNADFGTNLTSVDFVATDPTAPADLVLTKTHGDDFTVGTHGTYTLAVSNAGGAATSGPTTVTDVLPAGLSYVSAIGSGWDCGSSGQAVTCTTMAAVNPGSSLPGITLTVLPSSGGAITNTASVANSGDANSANNSASDGAVVNRPPVADRDIDTTFAATSVTVDVLANDSDPDGDSLTITTPAPLASRGTVTCTPSQCTYTPDDGHSGTDTFSYTISDGGGGTAIATVTITTTLPADLQMTKSHSGDFTRGVHGTYLLGIANTGGSPATGTTAVTDVLPSGLSYVSATGTGWTCTNAADTVTCTTATAVAAGSSAPAIRLTVLPTGGGIVTNTATVANTGDVNSANDWASDPTFIDRSPVADDDTVHTAEDIDVIIHVLDGDDLADTPTVITSHTQPNRGNVTCTTTACTYAPNADTSGTDSFTYTIQDADGDISVATVTVLVAPVNDPPVAGDDSATTTLGTPVTIGVLTNDHDVDADTITVATLVLSAAHGTVTCAATACTYRPDDGHAGTDTFTYAISDGRGGTAVATVTVTTADTVRADRENPTTTTTPLPVTSAAAAEATTITPFQQPPAAFDTPKPKAAPTTATVTELASVGASHAERTPTQLPRTGQANAVMALIGLLLVSAGSLLTAVAQRRGHFSRATSS